MSFNVQLKEKHSEMKNQLHQEREKRQHIERKMEKLKEVQNAGVSSYHYQFLKYEVLGRKL